MSSSLSLYLHFRCPLLTVLASWLLASCSASLPEPPRDAITTTTAYADFDDMPGATPLGSVNDWQAPKYRFKIDTSVDGDHRALYRRYFLGDTDLEGATQGASFFVFEPPNRDNQSTFADTVLSIERMPAQSVSFQPNSHSAAIGATACCGIVTSITRIRVLAESPDSINSRLRDLYNFSYAGAARYDFASTLDGFTRSMHPGQDIYDFFEAGLGDRIAQTSFERLASNQSYASVLQDLSIEIRQDTRDILYVPGSIWLGKKALKDIVVFAFLHYPNERFQLPRCVNNKDMLIGNEKVFCAGLLANLEQRGIIDLSGRRDASDGARFVYSGGDFRGDRMYDKSEVGLVMALWAEVYGHEAVDAYLDAMWAYIEALSSAVKSGHDCVEVSSSGILLIEETQCRGLRKTPTSQITGSDSPIINSVNLLIAHEISHALLDHRYDDLNGIQRLGFSECEANMVLEAEADILSGVLFSELHAPTDEPLDFFGGRLVSKDGPVLFEDAFEHYALVRNWMPFFHGWVALRENQFSKCGYYNARTRIALFYAYYVWSTRPTKVDGGISWPFQQEK